MIIPHRHGMFMTIRVVSIMTVLKQSSGQYQDITAPVRRFSVMLSSDLTVL